MSKKLKDTDFSIGEDYSLSVRTARRHLVAFAKQKSEKFQIRFKTLHMGSKRYIFDHASQSVIEVAKRPPCPQTKPHHRQIKSRNELSFSVIFTNIRRLMPKCQLVSNLVASSNSNILVLTETWLTNEVTEAEVLSDLPDFQLFRTDRKRGRGCGVLIAVGPEIPGSAVDIKFDLEFFWLICHASPQTFLLGVR